MPPALPKHKQRNKAIRLTLNPTEHATLAALAERENRSMSNWIRHRITEAAKRKGIKIDK